METKDPRKSKNVEERRKAAKADYRDKQDMSWAREDSDGIVRQWAAWADYRNEQDLSWGRTDSYDDVRRLAAIADYESKRDLSWARTDSYRHVRYWAARQEKDRMKEIETRMETKNPRKKKVETKNPRKSSNVEERRNAAEADYDNNQDMSWARTDSDSNVRWWAAKIDYENKQDLSWASTDNSENVRHWLKRQEEDRKRENKQKTKVMSGQKKNLANKKHIDKKLNGSDLFKKVLEGVFNFTLKEKGDERHGNGLDLWEQPWAKITETEGTGFLTGQAIKKIMEIKNIPEKARKLNEIKGAISYLVFYYLYLDKKE